MIDRARTADIVFQFAMEFDQKLRLILMFGVELL